MNASFAVLRRAAIGPISAALARDREGDPFYLLEPGSARAEDLLGRCTYLPEVDRQIVYASGAPVMVLKLPAGTPLDRIAGSALTEPEIVHALVALAHALAALEQAGVSLPAGVITRRTLIREASGHYRLDLPAACLDAVPSPGGWLPPNPAADLERLCLELLTARRPLGKNPRLHALDIFSRGGSARTLAQWVAFLDKLQRDRLGVTGRRTGAVRSALVGAVVIIAGALLLFSLPRRRQAPAARPPQGTGRPAAAPPAAGPVGGGGRPTPQAPLPAPQPDLPECQAADRIASAQARAVYLDGRAVCTAYLQLDPRPAISLDTLGALLGADIRIDGYDDYALDLAVDGRAVMIPAGAAWRLGDRWWLSLSDSVLSQLHLQLRELNASAVQLARR